MLQSLSTVVRHAADVRVRGTVVDSLYEHGLPWGWMRVDPERLTLSTPLRGDVVHDRSGVEAVEVWRVRLVPFGAAQVLAVKLTSGAYAETMFVAARHRHAVAVLQSSRWPVRDGGRRGWRGTGRP